MSAAAPGVLDYLMGTTFPTALSTFTDPVTGSLPTIYFGDGLPHFTTPITLHVPGIKISMDWATIGPNLRYEETGTIPCTLTSWVAGQADSPAFLDRKNECFNALSLITINIANDVTLNGLVRWVRFSMGQLMPAKGLGANGATTGSMAHLDFELSYAVRVDSLDATANVYPQS